ncbi:MAG TPA: ABC transporter substrate-binding protein, partial [Burkholderiales bacterium]
LEQHPWVAMSVVQAFEQAKELGYRRMRDPRNLALAWVREAREEQQAVLGKDAWTCVLVEPNSKAIEAVVRYAYDQGMIKKKPRVEELFFAPSLQEIQHYL